MANLDISEHRIPQDGRFKLIISKEKSVDFRISTCPTLHGEKIVMRILDPTSTELDVDVLGFEEYSEKTLSGCHCSTTGYDSSYGTNGEW